MTLIEVVIVIAIIATLAAVAIPSIVTTLDLNDRVATMEKMDNLEIALNNYYEDVGEYPSVNDLTADGKQLVNDKSWSSIDFLVYNPYPEKGTSIKDTVRRYGWNGPYLTASFHKDDYKKDAWGRAIYYQPQYGRSRAESADGQQYAGAEGLPANAALLASMGKTPGWGFRDASGSYSGGPTLGMLTWRELCMFIPYSELFGGKYEHILKDNVIKVISCASIDRTKAEETKKRFEEVRTAICGSPEDLEGGGCIAGFAADLGLALPKGAAETVKPAVPLNLDDFRDFDNPLQLLIMRFVDPGSKDLSYGAPRDVPPPYRMGDSSRFNVQKGNDLGYSWMGWRGPYMTSDFGNSYVNEDDDMVMTYDCFLDGWKAPLAIHNEGDAYAGAVLDLGFGNRDEDLDNYASLAGLIASPGSNRIFDRMTGMLLDPNLMRGGNPSGTISSEGQDDDDVFVPLYKRDLWANIAPNVIIEAMDEPSTINTPVDIEMAYNTKTLPSVQDYVSGIAVIYPDPKEAPGFNVVELMSSGFPIPIMSPTNQHIYKDSFTQIETNQFIPVGYAFFYIKVVHHRDIGSQDTGYCMALQQRLGWEEVAWTGVTQTQIYGERVCVKNGISTISLEFTLLGGG